MINNDKSLNDFLSNDDEIFDFTKDEVHPLFYQMQKYIVKDRQSLQLMMERKYAREMGHSNIMKQYYSEGFLRAKINEINALELT